MPRPRLSWSRWQRSFPIPDSSSRSCRSSIMPTANPSPRGRLPRQRCVPGSRYQPRHVAVRRRPRRAGEASALGRCRGLVELAPPLGRLLADSTWQVRRDAGTALAQLGPMGRVVLRCHLQDEDRFARDMAIHILGQMSGLDQGGGLVQPLGGRMMTSVVTAAWLSDGPAIFDGVAVVLAAVVIITALLQVVLMIAAVIDLRQSHKRSRHRLWRAVMNSSLAPKVTVLVPAYNEAVTIRDSLAGILALTYQNLEVVVVNDGSSDETEAVLVDEFDLVEVHNVYQSLLDTQRIVRLYRSLSIHGSSSRDKENGGKADTLDACREPRRRFARLRHRRRHDHHADSLQKLVTSFVDDPAVVAAGGSVRLTNGGLVRGSRGVCARCSRPRSGRRVRWSSIAERFLIGRLGWNQLGGNLIVSRPVGVFRRQSVVDVGGYRPGSMGEDMELIGAPPPTRLRAGTPAKVTFDAEPVAWTEGPEGLSELRRQRDPLVSRPARGAEPAPQDDPAAQVRTAGTALAAVFRHRRSAGADHRGHRHPAAHRRTDLRAGQHRTPALRRLCTTPSASSCR